MHPRPSRTTGLRDAAAVCNVTVERYRDASPLDGEDWRAVPGYEGLYSVSSMGRVRSEAKVGWAGVARSAPYPIAAFIMNPTPFASGYARVSLSRRDGPAKTMRIHRMVLLAFVGPAPQGQECLHNNGMRHDNRLSNLRWGTPSENARDAIRHGTNQIARISREYVHLRSGEQSGSAKLTEQDVRFIRASSEAGQRLAEKFGVNRNAILAVRKRTSWKHIA